MLKVYKGDNLKITSRQFRPLDLQKRDDVETVFKVNLKDRSWGIVAQNDEIEITFFDKDNCFGWLERLHIIEFMRRLDEHNMYLKLC